MAPQINTVAAEGLTTVFDDAARAGSACHLDRFPDQMPRFVWQFVDWPEDQARIRLWCEAALGTGGLPRQARKDLEALVNDLDRIEQYNRERKEWPAPPPITDKK